MQANFADLLAEAVSRKRTAAVVGIDPVYERLPDELRREAPTLPEAVAGLEAFGRELIDLVAAIVPAVKINSAFFEAYYELGVGAYYRLIEYAHARGLLVIGDVKRGDIGSTARFYAAGHLDPPRFADVDTRRLPDAVTVSGYLGAGAVAPFIEAAVERGAGVYVLVRPSDPDADVVHEFGAGSGGSRFYEHMASLVRAWGSAPATLGRCGLSCVGAVVAAKDRASTASLRAALPATPFLVPGFGAQGGTAEGCAACFLPGGAGAIVNASRSVIYAYRGARDPKRSDWRACVQEACRAFAADITAVQDRPGA